KLDGLACVPDGRRMSLSPDIRKRVLDEVAARSAARGRFPAQVVQTPSSNPPGDCAPIANGAAEQLEGLGFAVERHVVPADRVRTAGMISATILVVRRHFGPGPIIALNAHGDVVAPGEGWTHPPFAA